MGCCNSKSQLEKPQPVAPTETATPTGIPIVHVTPPEKAPEKVPEQPKQVEKKVEKEAEKTEPIHVELYTRGICPFSAQVYSILKYKGVDFKYVQLNESNVPEWFAEASPTGSVPVIKLSPGKYMNEATEMISWVEKKYPTPVLEKDEEWCKFVNTECQPALMRCIMGTNPMVQAEFRPKLKAAVAKITAQLEKSIGPYLLGETYNQADLLLAPIIRRLHLVAYFRAFNLVNPTIQKYIDTVENHFCFTDVCTPMEQMKTVLKKEIPKMSPISIGKLQHNSIGANSKKILDLLNKVDGLDGDEAVKVSVDACERISKLCAVIVEHANFEEKILYSVFEAKNSGITKQAHDEHDHEAPILDSFIADCNNLAAVMKDQNRVDKDEMKKLRERFVKFDKDIISHMESEEEKLFPLAQSLQGDEASVLFKKIWASMGSRISLLPFILSPLNGPERAQYLHNIESNIKSDNPDEWKKVQEALRAGLSKEEYDDLVDRLPSFA